MHLPAPIAPTDLGPTAGPSASATDTETKEKGPTWARTDEDVRN